MAQALTVVSGGGPAPEYSTLKGAVDAINSTDSTITISGTWTSPDTAEFTVDSGGLTITATGESATNGIAEAHTDGKSNAYRLQVDGGTSSALPINLTGGCTFKGFEIEHVGTGVSAEIFRFVVGATLNLDSMLLYFSSRTDQQDIIYTNGAVVTVNAENCVAYNAYRAFLDQYQNDDCTLNTNCCTFYDIGFDNSASSRSGIFGMNGTGTHTWNSLNCILDVPPISYEFVQNGGTNVANHDYQCCSSGTEGDVYKATMTVNETGNDYDTDIEVGPGAAGKVSVIDVTGVGNAINLNLYDDSNNAALDFCQIAPDADGANSGLTMLSVDIAGNTRYAGTSGYYDCGAFSIQSAPAATDQATRLGLGGFPRPPMGTAAITPVDSVSGTIGVTLGAFAPSGAGTSTDFITGTVGVTLDTYVPAGTGVSTDNIAGTIVVTMAPFVGAAVGTSLSGVGGSIATTLSSFVGAAAGQLVVTGDITTTMAAFNAVLAGTVTDAPNGSIAAVMDSFVAAAEGSGGIVTLTHFSGADYYHTLFGALPGETTIDAEYRYLIANGASKAAIPDMWVELLTAAGYSGGLNAMWRAWQANGATW